MASMVAAAPIASKDSPAAKMQQLFEPSDQLPDIDLRPDSAACLPRVKSAPPARSLSQSSQPSGTSKLLLPLTPQQAIDKFRRSMTAFELEEILQFPQVYFVGPLAKKIAAREDAGPNSGFDDDKGRYKLVKNDHIGYRYEVLKGLGRGSFGEVVRAYDHKTQQHYALKIIRNERRFHKQGQIEIKILEHLRKEDRRNTHNVVHFKEWFVFRNHICITFELLHSDLYSALKNDGFRGFAMAQVQHFAFNLLVCLRVLHKSHLIHCDLKPENILLCRKDSTDIKVIDFGSACFDTQRVHTYIQSRFYRSPEVILGANYGVPIDMWSLGCILVELATGQPLFPGHDEKEQLLLQMEVLGLPPPSMMEKSKRFSIFFDSAGQPRLLQDNKGRRRLPDTRSLAKVLGRSEPTFEDFVLRCLRWDPDERMTPKDALRHPFVGDLVAAAKMRRTASEGAQAGGAGAGVPEDELADAMDSMSMTVGSKHGDGPSAAAASASHSSHAQPSGLAAAVAAANVGMGVGLGHGASYGAPPPYGSGYSVYGSGSSTSIPSALAPLPPRALPPMHPPATAPSARLVSVQAAPGSVTSRDRADAPSASSGGSVTIPAALMPRRPSLSSRLTTDQQAHAERIRQATGPAPALARRPSLSREKSAS